ncbi:MAG: T9SS type A sorting domain-containing protein, partial [Anaerolineales bacterium]
DKERYSLQYDQNANPIPVLVNLEAKLTQGGESSGLDDHTLTVGEPVNDALVSVEVTSPDGQMVVGRLAPSGLGDGIYTIALQTELIGNYDITVIASDNSSSGSYNNSQYLITTEHSFYVSPYENPTELTGKIYIQKALDELNAIMAAYCPANNNCSLDKNTKRDINSAISLISQALGYFEADGNHLKSNKGLSFYDNITQSVNDIYSYISNPDFGTNIDDAINYLKLGSYKIAVIIRDEAQEPGACQVSNCDQLIDNANDEIGKALDESKQNNYVYIFNHLTNAWKFAMNVFGNNYKNQTPGDNSETLSALGSKPTKYALQQNYPNPFNPTTKIDFQLPDKNFVTIKIYDIRGNLVTTLISKQLDSGYYSTYWNAAGYASGIYFYQLTAGSFVSNKRMILLK